jgi:hypothetical protein
VVGEGDVIVLKALKPPRPEEFTKLLDEVQEAARQAGITPADVERALQEVRAEK